jgi:cation:H+ antiporter
VYVWHELRDDGDGLSADELEPLKIRPHAAQPGLSWAVLQSVAALARIVIASHELVRQIGVNATWAGMSPPIGARLLAPVATELPEIMNAVIWVRQGKERLALANISGSMMIQATIPSALAIFMTPWHLDTPLLVSGGITLLSIACLWLGFRQDAMRSGVLARSGGLYLLIVVFVVVYFGF